MTKPCITRRKPRKPNWVSENLRDITATGLERTHCETTDYNGSIQTTRVHVNKGQTVVNVDCYGDFKTITFRDDDGNETVVFLSLSQADLVLAALANPSGTHPRALANPQEA